MIRLKTSMGDIVIELDEQAAPKTCENFRQYVTDGFYDGTIFHRVIDGFMIQGGGFLPDMMQKATRDPIENEAASGLGNTTGTIAMARTMQPHSATAQFFINLKDNEFLDHTSKDRRGWGYAVFGRVTDGMDVVDAIAAVPTGTQAGRRDVPRETVLIESIRRLP